MSGGVGLVWGGGSGGYTVRLPRPVCRKRAGVKGGRGLKGLRRRRLFRTMEKEGAQD